MQALKEHKLLVGLSALLIPASALFFVSALDATALPTMRYLWNMGHVVFFALLTLAVGKFRPWQSMVEVFIYLGAILLLSLTIEFTQRFLGRDLSAMDMLRNLIGCMITLLFTARKYLHISVISFLSFVFAFDLTGLAVTSWTDIKIQTRAPIVENFESEFTLARWGGVGELSLTAEQVKEGNTSAKAVFPIGHTYSGIGTHDVLRNWSGYEFLHLAIFNPHEETLTMTMRIHDGTHENKSDQQYLDRYNTQLTLEPGWNDLQVPLSEIQNAPDGRTMDMTNITNIGLFFSNLELVRVLYLDDFHLK